MKLWLIAIGKFLARAAPKFLVNRSVLKLTGKKSLMLLSFLLLTAGFFLYDREVNVFEALSAPFNNTSNRSHH
jgi:hypothetical protein